MYKKQGTAGCITLKHKGLDTEMQTLQSSVYIHVLEKKLNKKKSHLSTYYIDFLGKKHITELL